MANGAFPHACIECVDHTLGLYTTVYLKVAHSNFCYFFITYGFMD